MSTQKIILPDFVIASLYGNNLVVGSDIINTRKNIEKPITPKAPKPEQQKISADLNKQWYLGNNGKQITIIVKELNAAYINEIEQKNQPICLILFDVSPTELLIPLAIEPYNVVMYNNCQILLAPALSVMDGDSIVAKTEKGKLWMSLKKMFQL
jgi:hypothetical protein